MQTFSRQQLSAVQEAVEAYRERIHCWVTLLAPMQSGKTETFLLIACELIRLRVIENIVIFSGNAETDLRDQLHTQANNPRSQFFKKYKRFLRVNGMDDEDERDEFIDSIAKQIQIVWGTELKSFMGPTEKTIFIWEEAHYAQSQEQRPYKFLRKIGVSADGNAEHLQRKNNLMLTVSATPFSELSDNLRMDQGKKVVKMSPGETYVSIKNIRDSGRIRSFHNKEDGLGAAFNLNKQGKKWYAIIRISSRYAEMVKTYIEMFGWKYVEYDSLSVNREEGEYTWKNMDIEPAENTVILIRGKCRMGKNLEKKHLLFVFETSKKSKTDTVLQSLLGRVCGYSEGSDRVVVYLSEKITESGEINRYIELWERDDVQILPTNANNLIDKKVKHYEPIIPIGIAIDRTRFPTTNNRNDILECVEYAFATGNGLLNKNSEYELEEVKRKVLNGDRRKKKNHYLDINSRTRGERPAREITAAYDNGIARDFGSGCGIDSEATEVNIWIMRNIPGYDRDILYVTAHVTREEGIENCDIPITTGNEVFAHRLEDGTEEQGNGGMVIRLSCQSANNENSMCDELFKMIEISLSTTGCERRIASCWDDGDKEFKGILVTPEIYNKLQVNGSIFNYIQDIFNVELRTCKSRGRVSRYVEERGLIRLASISW